MFINVEFKNEVIDIDPLFPKRWIFINFKSFYVHSLAFSGVRVQHPKPSVHRPEYSIQGPESSVQSQASNSCVQSPGIPVCLNNVNSGKNSLNSFTAEV